MELRKRPWDPKIKWNLLPDLALDTLQPQDSPARITLSADSSIDVSVRGGVVIRDASLPFDASVYETISLLTAQL